MKRKWQMDKTVEAEQAHAVRELVMRQFNFEFPRAFSEQGQQLLERMAGFNTALGEFLVRRGNRNVEAFTRLMQSKSPPDVFLLQTQWLRDAADDYTKEAARLSEAYGKLFGSSWGLKAADAYSRNMRLDRLSKPVTSSRE
jgi:hypothetical protein